MSCLLTTEPMRTVMAYFNGLMPANVQRITVLILNAGYEQTKTCCKKAELNKMIPCHCVLYSVVPSLLRY